MAHIGFIGDVYPGRDGGLTIDASVAGLLARFDLVVANLESPITGLAEPAVAKGTHLRSDPGSESLLEVLSVDAVTIANNHMFDFGEEGFLSTTAALDHAGVSWLGAGSDLEAARRPLVMTVSGLRLGFTAYSAPEIETIVAGAGRPGCAPVDPDAMRSDIAALRSDVDVVVVLVHWGLMGYELPRPRERDLGAGLIEFGADVVVGSHPHVLQGARTVGDGLVAHSLGDFAFYPETAAGRPINQYRVRQTGAILELEVAPRRVVSHRFHLTRQRAATITVENSVHRARALRRSTRRVAAEEGAYRRIWRRYALSRTLRRLVGRLAPWKWRTIRPGTVRGFGVALREIFRRS